MATQFDMGLLGDLFGGGSESGLEGYLTPQQQQAMSRQGLLQAALAIGQASGPSTTPRSLMQILGSGVQAGQQGYQSAQENAIKQLLTKQKLDEYKRQVADEQAYKDMFAQMPTVGTPMTPEQALSVGGGQVGPTTQRAAMIGMPTPAGSIDNGMPALTQVQRDILRRMPAKEGRAELLKMVQPSEFSAPQPQVVDGQVQMVQYNKRGESRVVSGAMPYEKPEASPTEVRLLQAAGMPVNMENIMAIRRSGASNVNVTQNAEKKGVEVATTQAMKNLDDSRMMAQSANATLSNIDRILPALDTAIVGPAADTRTTLLRIGKQLNIAGADANQVLRNTATVVQGLAQQELDAASQMRGQGALTEGERAILRRAAGGDQSLTSGELQQGLMAAQRSARARIASHQDLLNKATTAIPSLSTIAPMYQVEPYGAPQQNPFQNAVQQEIDRRKAAGGRR
jgi:hypothetical protein